MYAPNTHPNYLAAQAARRRHIGEKYNSLTITSDSFKKGKGRHYYVTAVCSCGNTITQRYDSIKSGITKSCGCGIKLQTTKAIALATKHVGQVFGKLTIIGYVKVSQEFRSLCLCECGNTKVLRYGSDLMSGEYTSCGCAHPLTPGPSHYRYDPDRQAVAMRKKLRDFMHDSLRRVLLHGKTSSLKYKVKDLKEHLEKQFTPEMSWENQGTYWHIDHIIPIDYFLKTGETNPAIINALTNLQPLSAIENLKKANKIL